MYWQYVKIGQKSFLPVFPQLQPSPPHLVLEMDLLVQCSPAACRVSHPHTSCWNPGADGTERCDLPLSLGDLSVYMLLPHKWNIIIVSRHWVQDTCSYRHFVQFLAPSSIVPSSIFLSFSSGCAWLTPFSYFLKKLFSSSMWLPIQCPLSISVLPHSYQLPVQSHLE